MPDLGPPPSEDRILEYDPKNRPTGKVSFEWLTWFLDFRTRARATFQSFRTLRLQTQQASIGATVFPFGALTAGLYRITYYARITQAGTVSSSLTPIFSWTDGGIACSKSFAAMTGNTTGTVQSDSLLMRLDTAAPLTYSTTYASVGATAMQYEINYVLERVTE